MGQALAVLPVVLPVLRNIGHRRVEAGIEAAAESEGFPVLGRKEVAV